MRGTLHSREPYFVPVDQRWLGIDKRGIPYAVVAVALIVLLTRWSRR